MAWLFAESKFNCNISNWDVSNVKNTHSMFYGSNFNSDISNWDVSSAKNMSNMFADSNFNQDISNWKINKNCYTIGIFTGCSIKKEYKPELPR